MSSTSILNLTRNPLGIPGIRIDHILLSPQAADRLHACGIDKHVRGREKPPDHVPVWCELAV